MSGPGDTKKTVWILGAGFSRSLGGPLLADLLSPSARAGVDTLYKDCASLKDPAVAAVRQAFELHAAVVRSGRSPFWNDAEEFLDQLDAAARPGGAERLRVLLGDLGVDFLDRVKLEALRDAARRLVAAECCAFLEGADLELERWQPYRSWARMVKFPDVILTFNYDRVLERLGGFAVVPPDCDDDHALTDEHMAAVFKLHGSVDWRRQEGAQSGTQSGTSYHATINQPSYALTCADFQIGLATPGPSKRIATADLRGLWEKALGHLREADAIVFVGYRFPPTDAEARAKLLRAIERNHEHATHATTRKHHLSLHIVLGPDRGDSRIVRLEGLLREMMERAGRHEEDDVTSATWTFSINTHPLFAEDFFTVWSPERLHRGRGFHT